MRRAAWRNPRRRVGAATLRVLAYAAVCSTASCTSRPTHVIAVPVLHVEAAKSVPEAPAEPAPPLLEEPQTRAAVVSEQAPADVPFLDEPLPGDPPCKVRASRPSLDEATLALIDDLVAMQKQARAEQSQETETVSPLLRSLLPRMKSTSREIVRRVLASVENRASACGESLSRSVLSLLKGAGVAMYDPSNPVGSLGGIDVLAASGKPSRWVVSVSFPLPCQDDGSFYVFEETGRGPELAMAVERNEYDDVGDAQGSGVARLSAVDRRGHYFLVVADWVPRCGPGTYRGLRVRVLEPGGSPERPRLSFEWEKSTLSDDLDVRTETGAFAVSVLDTDSVDFPRARNLVRAYKRSAGRFMRVQPYADKPRDFPVEWTSLPWDEASKVCAHGKQAELEAWHKRFNETFEAVFDDQDRVSFDRERPGRDARRTSVSFRCDTDAPDRRVCKRLPTLVTFEMIKDGKGWLIESIAGREIH